MTLREGLLLKTVATQESRWRKSDTKYMNFDIRGNINIELYICI